ncbi:MAG: DUF397 domain-containing protein [Labedaea sp.]
MSLPTNPTTTWRKSSFSGGGNGACVEVSWPRSEVAVRDSKNPSGSVLTFPRSLWRRFLAGA